VKLLRNDGWKVIIVWTCRLKRDNNKVMKTITNKLFHIEGDL
jgi:G:T-mismatch repair DNA endonuclease (very short patch repair protein)